MNNNERSRLQVQLIWPILRYKMLLREAIDRNVGRLSARKLLIHGKRHYVWDKFAIKYIYVNHTCKKNLAEHL